MILILALLRHNESHDERLGCNLTSVLHDSRIVRRSKLKSYYESNSPLKAVPDKACCSPQCAYCAKNATFLHFLGSGA